MSSANICRGRAQHKFIYKNLARSIWPPGTMDKESLKKAFQKVERRKKASARIASRPQRGDLQAFDAPAPEEDL